MTSASSLSTHGYNLSGHIDLSALFVYMLPNLPFSAKVVYNLLPDLPSGLRGTRFLKDQSCQQVPQPSPCCLTQVPLPHSAGGHLVLLSLVILVDTIYTYNVEFFLLALHIPCKIQLQRGPNPARP